MSESWNQTTIAGMQQGIIFASAFFSCVASTREVLPGSCFANVVIGKSAVAGLKVPPTRFALPAHKGLYEWIVNDLRVALSTMRDLTASLIAGDEVFQIHAVRKEGRVQTVDELCTSVQTVIRSLGLWIENSDRENTDSTIRLDIAKGFVRFGKEASSEDDDSDLFDADVKSEPFGVDNKLDSLNRCVDLGTVTTATLVLDCIYYCRE